MSEQLNVFSKRLRQARILKKISMDQLASMIGNSVSKQAISSVLLLSTWMSLTYPSARSRTRVSKISMH